MRVLVTGGAGALGSNLVDRLLVDHDCDVTVVDDLSQGRASTISELTPKGRLRFIQGDINSVDILEGVFQRGIDVVFHFAASFANELSVEQPLHDSECNIRGTLSLLMESARRQVRLFIYASSSSIYGQQANSRLDELDVPNPSTPYAVSKLAAEFYCKSMAHLYGLNYVILRLSNVYGPWDYPGRYRNVVPNFMRNALERKPLVVTGTGDETRDYTFVGDCLEGVINASQCEEAYNQVFNLGTGTATKTIDLAKAILKVTGSDSEIVLSEPRYFDCIKQRVMNIDKARRIFGYDPKTALQNGLAETFEWFALHGTEALRV